jgi:hypothetical protein
MDMPQDATNENQYFLGTENAKERRKSTTGVADLIRTLPQLWVDTLRAHVENAPQ